MYIPITEQCMIDPNTVLELHQLRHDRMLQALSSMMADNI